jgi:hypothetical protein
MFFCIFPDVLGIEVPFSACSCKLVIASGGPEVLPESRCRSTVKRFTVRERAGKLHSETSEHRVLADSRLSMDRESLEHRSLPSMEQADVRIAGQSEEAF